MRIHDGKYVLTSKTAVEESLEMKREAIEELKGRLSVIAEWADRNLDLHVPYVSGRIDISVSASTNRKADFLDRLQRNLWCTECSTPWPCAKIDRIKSLRDFALGHGPADFEAAVEKITPKTREGQFSEVCL